MIFNDAHMDCISSYLTRTNYYTMDFFLFRICTFRHRTHHVHYIIIVVVVVSRIDRQLSPSTSLYALSLSLCANWL